MSTASAKHRPPAPLEVTLWVALLLLAYFLAPLLAEPTGADGIRLPLLSAEASFVQRAIALGGMGLLGLGGALLGERYLLIEKGQRVTMLLFLLAFLTMTPSLGLVVAGALLIAWLLLFLQFGTYQDPRQRHTYLLLGMLTGGLALANPLYLVLLFPLLLWGGYHLRSLSVRSVVALVMGILLPLWIAVPILALQGEEVLLRAYAWVSAPLALPDLSQGIRLPTPMLVTYLLYLVLFLLGALLYRGRYYRESVRHRDTFATLLRYPLLVLLLFPLLGREASALLPLCFLPLALLLARGLSGLPPRMERILRSLLLLLCLIGYLYRLGVIEALGTRFF